MCILQWQLKRFSNEFNFDVTLQTVGMLSTLFWQRVKLDMKQQVQIVLKSVMVSQDGIVFLIST